MNIYDTANKLASEIKQSEEFSNYKKSKEALQSNSELKTKIDKFDKLRVDMKKAMNESLMIGNNIYIEEENKNE